MFKKYLLLYLAVFSLTAAWSQTNIYNPGTEITNMGSDIYISGSYINGPNGTVANGGTIYITDSVVNNSVKHLFVTDTGRVVLNGTGKQVIAGSSYIRFSQLEVNKPGSEVVLNQHIEVNDTLYLEHGNLFLNGYAVDLDTFGILAGESSGSRIYGESGSVKAVRFLDSSRARLQNNIAGLGLFVSSREQFGYVTIERGHGRQQYTGDTSIYRYYDFIPQNSFSTGMVDTLKIAYLEPEAVPGESNYKIFASVNEGTDWNNKGGIADSVNRFVQTTTVSPPEIGKARFSVFPTENFATCPPNDPHYISAVFLVSTTVLDGDSTQFVQLTSPAPLDYAWNFGDASIPEEDFSPYHIYHLAIDSVSARYQVTMTVTNGVCSDTRKKYVTVNPRPALKNGSTVLYGGFESVGLYPNPNAGMFTLAFKTTLDSDVVISIMDIHGKILEQRTVRSSASNEAFDFNHLEAGMYYIKLQTGEEMEVLKMLKL